MEEKSKRFRNAFGNLYRKQGGPELVSEEDIKKALKLRENRTDRKLNQKEIELQKRIIGVDKERTKGKAKNEIKPTTKSSEKDREMDD